MMKSLVPPPVGADDLSELLDASPKYLPQVHADFGVTPFERARAECIRMEDALTIARRVFAGWR